MLKEHDFTSKNKISFDEKRCQSAVFFQSKSQVRILNSGEGAGFKTPKGRKVEVRVKGVR